MNVKPEKKRYKPYTRAITVTELLIDIDTENIITDIILRHFPISDTDDNREVLFTIYRYEIIAELLANYGEWSFVYNSTSSPTSIYNYTSPQFPLTAFNQQWGDYVKYNKDNWERIVSAFSAKYDPISNYDRHEAMDYTDTLTKKGSVTNSNDNYQFTTNSGTVTNTYGKVADVDIAVDEPTRDENGKITNGKEVTVTITPKFSPDGVTTTNKSSTYDSDTPITTQTSNTAGIQQTMPNTVGYGKNLSDSTMKYSDDYKEETTHKDNGSRVYGNVGVTTSATMVNEIAEVYKVDILRKIISDFANKYLVYLPVDEDLEESEGCLWW